MIGDILEKVRKRFPDLEINEEEIKKRLELLLYEFKIPASEAERTIVNYIAKTYNVQPQVLSKELKVEEIPKAYEGDKTKYATLEVKVAKLWEPTSENIAQAGLVGDETGLIRFVTWKNAEQPPLEEGKTYRLENVVIDKYADRYSIQITRLSKVIEIDKDIQLPENTVEFTAPIVAILSNSGLIQRCPECGRVVNKNICPVHGVIKPEDDLRLKCVFDNGDETYYAILNEDVIAKLTGINLEKALEIARETLERSAVLSELTKSFLCKYYHVKGRKVGNYILVEDIAPAKPNVDEIKEVIMYG